MNSIALILIAFGVCVILFAALAGNKSNIAEHPLFSGLLNPYSLCLLVICFFSLVIGALILWNGNLLGLIPFVWGVLMFLGFDFPSQAAPSKVWLITAFGEITNYRVYGLTFLFHWLFGLKIVSYEEIVLKQEDFDLPFKKPILCKKDNTYIEGYFSVSAIADDETALKLKQWINVGKVDGLKSQLDDLGTFWVQYIANKKREERSSLEMELDQGAIADEFLDFITGKRDRIHKTGYKALDDTRGFGVKFLKFQLIISAVKEVRDARINQQVQLENKKGHLQDTENLNAQIAERLSIYYYGKKDEHGKWLIKPTLDSSLIPSVSEIRKQIIEDNLMDQRNLTGVFGGAIPVINTKEKSK